MENFENINSPAFKIKPHNQEEVDLVVDVNNSNEGQLTQIQDIEMISDGLKKNIEKYDEPYMHLTMIRNSLKKEQNKFQPESNEFNSKKQEIEKIDSALNSIADIVDEKQKSINKLNEERKYLIKNN
jgi:hypothetical protein